MGERQRAVMSEKAKLRMDRITAATQEEKLGSTLLAALESGQVEVFIQAGIVPPDFDGSGNFVLPDAGLLENSLILGGCIEQAVPFSGGISTNVQLSLGVAGDEDALAAPVSVFTGQSNGLKDGVPSTANHVPSFRAAYAPLIHCDVTGDTIGNLTDGEATVYIFYRPLQTA